MALSYEQLKGVFTQTFIRIYREKIPAPSFLRTFFPTQTYDTALVNIQVSRGTEKMAVDVEKGSRGNRNKFSLETMKAYQPAFYKEFFDATQLDNFDNYQNGSSTAAQIASLARTVAEKYVELRNKIERAKEKQCAQVFETGTVELINGDNINYKRKSTSMVDLAANGGYWTNTSATIEVQLKAGAQFLRQEGKNGYPEINLVMSGTAFTYFKANAYFEKLANWQNVQLIDIKMPQTSAFGAAYHGVVVAGAYRFHIWTYDEVYEDEDGNMQRYLPEDTSFMVPVKGYDFEMSHGAVPQIMRVNGGRNIIGRGAAEYYQWDNVDTNEMTHYYNIASAPLAIPISVDQIYTMTVLSEDGGEG